MLMVPKSARAHSIKSWVVPKSAVARERVKVDVVAGQEPLSNPAKPGSELRSILNFENQWWVGITCANKL